MAQVVQAARWGRRGIQIGHLLLGLALVCTGCEPRDTTTSAAGGPVDRWTRRILPASSG